jgi:membrane complex biogenesis BtpA family protein
MKKTSGKKLVVGMIHTGASPGTPAGGAAVRSLVDAAVREARVYRESGVDAVMIENMHDVPYLKGAVGPEVTATMTLIATEVKAAFAGPVGIQILAAANREALAVAYAAGLDFIRAEGFVYAHVADEGIIESCAAELLRYRKAIGAERVKVWADIKKKHSSHAITADVGITDTAHAAEFMRADAIIITGGMTGAAPSVYDIRAARAGTSLPIYLGSGITPENLATFWPLADGFIVGSTFKRAGDWRNPPDPRRIRKFLAAANKLRKSHNG